MKTKHGPHGWARVFARLACVGICAAAVACGGGSSSNANQSAEPRLEARFSASASLVAGEPLLLDGSSSTIPPTVGTLSYQWIVNGPGGSPVTLFEAEGSRPFFVPAAAGTYTAQLALRVADGIYAASSTAAPQTLTVGPAPALAPPTAAEVKTRIQTLAASASPWQAPDATSPTITVGAADAPSAIAPSRLLPWNRPEFIYSGDMQAAGTVFPDFQFGRNRAVSYASTTRAGNALTVDFTTDASSFEIFQKGLGYNSRVRVVVDGRLATANPIELPTDGSLRLTLVRFNSKAMRQIRLVMNDPYFGGIRVAESDTVTRPAAGTRLRAMFLGDSITEGPAGQNAPSSYALRTAELLGWKDAWVSGVGATGYLSAPSPKLTLRQRFAADVKAYSPNVLVVAAGVNDTGFSDAEIEAEARLLFDQIEAELPNTLVFVAGPWGTSGRVRSSMAAALKAAVGQRSNFIFVPNSEEAWFVDGGNALQYISADRTHPTPAGIDYLAGKLAAFIKSTVP